MIERPLGADPSSLGKPRAGAATTTLGASPPFWLRPFRLVAVLLALAAILAWGYTVAHRVASPYPVEWQEGTVTNHTFRLLDGLPVYIPPSAAFIPVLYPPFGYVVQGWSMRLLGRGLPAARAVSVVASLLIALLMARVIYRRTGSGLAALLAVGLFFAAYSLCLAWYDQARVDMLFLLLGLSALFLLDRPRLSAPVVMSSALLAVLSALTKQHGLVIAGVGFGHLLFRSRRHAVLYAATVVLVLGAVVLLLERATHGWFLMNTWILVGRFSPRLNSLEWALKKMARLAIPLGCAAAWSLAGLWKRDLARLVSVWTLGLVATSGAAFASLIHVGGTLNHLIPVVVFALIGQGFLVGELDHDQTRPRTLAALIGLALISFSLWPLPFAAVIPAAVRADQAKVVEEIAAIPGDVFVLEDSYYGWLAGKAMNPDGASLRQLTELGFNLPPEIVDGLATHRFQAVVLSDLVEHYRLGTDSGRLLTRTIEDHYAFSRSFIKEDSEVDMLRIPRYLYVPRTRSPGEG